MWEGEKYDNVRKRVREEIGNERERRMWEREWEKSVRMRGIEESVVIVRDRERKRIVYKIENVRKSVSEDEREIWTCGNNEREKIVCKNDRVIVYKCMYICVCVCVNANMTV